MNITLPRAVIEQALEALEQWNTPLYKRGHIITALRTALEQPEQEPVTYQDTADKCLLETVPAKGTLFHTAPLQRKPLTDDEIQALWEKAFDSGSSPRDFARAIEAAHGIREESNT